MAEIGTHETPGSADTARIQEYFAATNLAPHQHDEVPWCAAFVGWCLREVGLTPSGHANARSYLDWGVPLLRPVPGCVLVYSRPPNRANGHVTFYAGPGHHDPASYACLGGNQGNRVCVVDEPLERLLGMRWPEGYNPA
jgi:uncharacterized protein (TIGR02594 family)